MSKLFENQDAFIGEFVDESIDSLSEASKMLADLTDMRDRETINGIFRFLHFIKGSAAMLGLDHIAEFIHEVESALDLIRKGEKDPTRKHCEFLVEAIDLLLEMLACHVGKGDQNACDEAAQKSLIERLHNCFSERNSTESRNEKHDEEDTGEENEGAIKPETQMNFGSLRVDIGKIERILSSVGELFYIDEIFKHFTENLDAKHNEQNRNNMRTAVHHFNYILEQLYVQMLDIRKVPVLQLTRVLERLVRNLSRTQGKQIRIKVSGEKLRLDRQIIEVLNDPMIHIIRNAVDHGIEPPDKRAAAGKSKEATIRIDVQEFEENIRVAISDNGRGIDPEEIRANGVAKRFFTHEQATRMKDDAVLQFIFEPGFSTSEQVSDVSGRGVGLDVVKNKINGVKGEIKLHSELSKGTTFELYVPINKSMLMDGIAFQMGDNIYMMPFESVRMVLGRKDFVVQQPGGRYELAVLADETFPMASPYILSDDVENETNHYAVLKDRHGRQCLLGVDEVLGRRKVLVQKAENNQLFNLMFDGSFVMGDGRIGFLVSVEKFMDATIQELQ